ALDEIDRLEAQLTVYRDSSEVSRLNLLAPATDVPLEKGLFDLLALSARISEETQGAFDITAGALIKAWGFYRGPRRAPEEEERRQALTRVGMRHVRLDAKKQTAHFLRPGLEINLGSIGKGYGLDCAVESLRLHWHLSSAWTKRGRIATPTPALEPFFCRKAPAAR